MFFKRKENEMKKRLVSAVMAAMLSAASISPVVPVVSADDQFGETAVVMEEVEEAAAEDYTAEESYEEETAYEEVYEEASDYTEEETEVSEPAQEYVEESAETSEAVTDYADESAETPEAASDYADESAATPEAASDYEDESAGTPEAASDYEDESAETPEAVSDYVGEVSETSEQEPGAEEFVEVEESAETESDAAAEEAMLYAADTEDYFRVISTESSQVIDIGKDNKRTLHIVAISSYKSPIRYEWTKNGKIIDSNGAYCDVTEGGHYIARAYDSLGHEGSVSFDIYAERDLGAKPAGEVDENGKCNVQVTGGQKAVFEIDTSHITKNVSYKWMREEETIENNTTKIILPPDKVRSDSYICEISDGYNKQKITFNVTVDNQFSVSCMNPDSEDNHGQVIYVKPGDTIDLKAIIKGADLDSLKYSWFIPGDTVKMKMLYYGTRDGIKIENIDKTMRIGGEFTDRYGNKEYIYYDLIIENHLKASADENFKTTQKTVEVSNRPVTLKTYVKADLMDGISYGWFYDWLPFLGNEGKGREFTIYPDDLKDIPLGEVVKYRCEVKDKYRNSDTVIYKVKRSGYLTFDKTALSIGLLKNGTVSASMADSDKIVKIVPANKNVATATWSGSKITVKAGKTGGSTNIAVKTASGKVVKFKVTVPKPVLSFTSGGKTLTLKNGLSVNKGKSAAVAVKLANGDSIAKIVPSNSKVSCTWSGSRITVKGGKTAGTVNVAVRTKCGKVAKFKVTVK